MSRFLMSRCRIGTIAAALASAAPALAQDLVHKSPAQQEPIAIVGATIHPVSGPAIANGYVLFTKGKITEVGPLPHTFAAGVRQVDAKGEHVYPGLIGPYTQVGLTEIGAVRASHDMSEVGFAGITPEVHASVSINPDSTLIPVTRANGVLAAAVFPTGGVLPGRASVVRLEGWTYEDMTVKPDCGLIVNWPQARPITAWWMDKSEEDQLKDIRQRIQLIETTFDAAKAYGAARAAEPASTTDIRYEAMRAVFPPAFATGGSPTPPGAKQLPVFIFAQDYDQIVSAIDFAARHSLKAVIVGGQDAPLCAGLLKEHDISVLVLGTFRFPKRDDSPYDDAYTLPARLQAAGVRWCLSSSQETAHERNLPYAAAMAVAYGLEKDAALKSITLWAAQVLGVDDWLGSIEPGKDANLLVTDGDPLEMTTTISAAYIDGKQIDLSNKQTELEKKYREKYRQAGAGTTK